MADPPIPPAKHDPYAALRFRDYRLYALGVLLFIMAEQMQIVAVGWELYERTHSAMMLGYVGLVEFIPVFLLAIPGGQLADRFNRKTVLMIMQTLMLATSLGIVYLSWTQGPVAWFYVILGIQATVRALGWPSNSALFAEIIDKPYFENAAVWNSSSFQLASVLGPAIAGVLIGFQHMATGVYVLNSALFVMFFGCIALLRPRFTRPEREKLSLKGLGGGLKFLLDTKIILAAITLDMFAVLLGGATMLLPVYAKDILHAGPQGLGWLRAAPAIGAAGMALFLAHRPPMHGAGKKLLAVVIGFGLTTIVFGLSKLFWLSMLMLVLNGAFDNVSVIIRNSLLQLGTPDALRGRVLAVNSIFLGSSNELGGFESGWLAALAGPVFSVVFGGIGTIAVVLGVAWIFPQLVRLNRLEEAGQTHA